VDALAPPGHQLTVHCEGRASGTDKSIAGVCGTRGIWRTNVKKDSRKKAEGRSISKITRWGQQQKPQTDVKNMDRKIIKIK